MQRCDATSTCQHPLQIGESNCARVEGFFHFRSPEYLQSTRAAVSTEHRHVPVCFAWEPLSTTCAAFDSAHSVRSRCLKQLSALAIYNPRDLRLLATDDVAK